MKFAVTFLAVVLVAMLPPESGHSAEIAVWTGDPIKLRLQLGVTRRIQLQQTQRVRVGLPPRLFDELEVESIGNSIWITAHTALTQARFVIESQPTGEHLVFAVHTTTDEVDPVLKVEDAPPPAASIEPSRLGFVALTRWAVREIYSPQRLRQDLTGLSLYPNLVEELDLFRCGPNPPALCGGAVQARLKSSWRTIRYYLSIVEISNRLDQPVTLDPREIRGDWRTATFVHSRLSPVDDPNSVTTLVLISDLPPEQAIDR